MSNIVIYSGKFCPYCMRAKSLFQRKNAQFTEIMVADEKTKTEMVEKSGGRMTVPQIFIDNKHIGGYDDLEALDRAGKLDELL